MIEEENNGDSVVINDKVDDDDARKKLVSGLKSFLERRNTARSESERVRMEDSIKKAKIPEGESKFMKLNGRADSEDSLWLKPKSQRIFMSFLVFPIGTKLIPRPENPTTLNEDEEGVVQHGNGEYVHCTKVY